MIPCGPHSPNTLLTARRAVRSVSPSSRASTQGSKEAGLISPPMMLRVPQAVSIIPDLESAQSHTARFGNSSTNQLVCSMLDTNGSILPQPHAEPQSSQESPHSVVEPAPEPMQASQDTVGIINEACSIAVQSMINTASAHYNGRHDFHASDSEQAIDALCQAHELQQRYCTTCPQSSEHRESQLLRTRAMRQLPEWTPAMANAQQHATDPQPAKSPSRYSPALSRHGAGATSSPPVVSPRRPCSRTSSRVSTNSKSNPPTRQCSLASNRLSSNSSRSPHRPHSTSPLNNQAKSRASSNASSRSPIASNSPAMRIKTSVATPQRQRVASTNAAMRHLAGFGFRPPRPAGAKACDVVEVVTVADIRSKNRSVTPPGRARPPCVYTPPKHRGAQVGNTPRNGNWQSTPSTPRTHTRSSGLMPNTACVGCIVGQPTSTSRRSSAPARLGAASLKPRHQVPARSTTPFTSASGILRSNPLAQQPGRKSQEAPESITPPLRQSKSRSPGPSRSNSPSSHHTNSKSPGPSRSNTPPSRHRSVTPPRHPSPKSFEVERQISRSRSPIARNAPEIVKQTRMSLSPASKAKESMPVTPKDLGDEKTPALPKDRPRTPSASRIDSRVVEWINEILKPASARTRVVGDQSQVISEEHILPVETCSQHAAIDLAHDKMRLHVPIGSGSFGTVWRGTYEGEIVAVKQCTVNDPRDMETLLGELRCLKRFGHPRLVSFLGCCSQGTSFFIVMEYMPGGSLHEVLFKKQIRLEFREKARIASEVSQGLSYLHRLGVVHRDLKTMNIILDDCLRSKICDFGLALALEKSHCTVRALQGSPRYMAPEQFETVVKITNKVDIWQFGCVLLELCCLHVPFANCAGIQQIATELLVHRKAPTVPIDADPRARVVITACFRMRPQLRPTSEVLEKVFNKLCN